MPEFPIMARDKHEVIHATGYDHTGRIWTACGLRAEEMGAILAYEPDCPACLLLIDGPGLDHSMTRADEVQVGDTIEWCQRQVTVLQIQRTRRLKRSGRWFTVEVDGRHARLHWWDDETIRPHIIPPESGSNVHQYDGGDS